MEQLLDPTTILPTIAGFLHVQPSTLLFWIVALNIGGRAIARRIPSDATGFWGFVRQSAAILGVEVANRVTSGVTVTDVAKAALLTPPITDKVEAATEVEVPATPAPEKS
jgi:hypothetical protein